MRETPTRTLLRKRLWVPALLLLAVCCAIPGLVKAPEAGVTGQTPVLMAHGMFGTGEVWASMERVLQARGLKTRAITMTPVDGTASIADLASQLDRAAEAFRAETGAAKIDLIGHSMGALVIRYWLQRMGGRDRARRFVSLAGPHHGVVGGYLSAGKGAEQMRINSAFLKDLERDERPFGSVEAFSFYSPFDAIIVPPTSAILPGAAVNRAFRVRSHHRMIESDKIKQAVQAALLEGPEAFAHPETTHDDEDDDR